MQFCEQICICFCKRRSFVWSMVPIRPGNYNKTNFESGSTLVEQLVVMLLVSIAAVGMYFLYGALNQTSASSLKATPLFVSEVLTRADSLRNQQEAATDTLGYTWSE